MAIYSARIKVPKRTSSTKENGEFTFSMQEIMVDDIKAKSESRAKKAALKEGLRYMSYIFPTKAEQEELPDPEVVAIARIGKDGKPVSEVDANGVQVFLKQLRHKEVSSAVQNAVTPKTTPSQHKTWGWQRVEKAYIKNPLPMDVVDHVKEK